MCDPPQEMTDTNHNLVFTKARKICQQVKAKSENFDTVRFQVRKLNYMDTLVKD